MIAIPQQPVQERTERALTADEVQPLQIGRVEKAPADLWLAEDRGHGLRMAEALEIGDANVGGRLRRLHRRPIAA